MSPQQVPDSGPDFERRALAIARAIYDPSDTQGAVMHAGREHDGLFIDERSIVAFEFTTQRSKDKATHDAAKIRDILKHFAGQPENKFKLVQGFFVTQDEPTAEQRMAVSQVSTKSGIAIKAMSFISLQRTLIDTERYITLRRNAPFGSTAYQLAKSPPDRTKAYIEPDFQRLNPTQPASLDQLTESIQNGGRVVLTADFGAGKSETLRQIFERLRRLYFKKPAERRFPLHINLRECYGLRTPREMLARHAEDIGFPSTNSLVAAWRSGACDLLLDGFDELVPTRWVGGARDLRQVRWQALAAVRRLVDESPHGSGIAIAGRAQYFQSLGEVLETLGMPDGMVCAVQDFTQIQIQRFLGDVAVAEWVPPRPLLLKFLAENGLLSSSSGEILDPSLAWVQMLNAIAAREAERVESIPRASVKALLARIATVSRASDAGLGPISIDEMRRAFRDVCGYEADEEGLQLLLRLPGLAGAGGQRGAGAEETRRFVDRSLADAAYGQDLAEYVMAPFDKSHPLSHGVLWNEFGGYLAAGVCATTLSSQQFDPGVVAGALKQRQSANLNDAVLLDVIAVADQMGTEPSKGLSHQVSEVIVPRLQLNGDGSQLDQATLSECVIDVLDVQDLESGSPTPLFSHCLFGEISGWSHIPTEHLSRFTGCEIGGYSAVTQTTAGIVEAAGDSLNAVAMVVLKKVYHQAGAARRESSLARGLPLASRGLVPNVVSELMSAGYLTTVSRRAETLVMPVKAMRTRVDELLAAPHQFSLTSLGGS